METYKYYKTTLGAISSLLIAIMLLTLSACGNKQADDETQSNVIKEKKIGVLLVSHGSPSKNWRNNLLDLEKSVRETILKETSAQGVATAFMEYNGPSIATQLRKFDKDNFSDIIIVPIFLTVSPHSFEDIPTIVGLKESPQSMETLKIEKIERYIAKAKIHITPLLDFSDILEKNILRRVQALSKDPKNEGMVLVGYGDNDYDKEWGELFESIAKDVNTKTGIAEYTYAWCGHIAHYSSEPTTKAIEKILSKKEAAIVIPVLVAYDENFQIRIIGGGVEKVDNYKQKVIYKPDAILPDDNINQWVIETTKDYVQKIQKD